MWSIQGLIDEYNKLLYLLGAKHKTEGLGWSTKGGGQVGTGGWAGGTSGGGVGGGGRGGFMHDGGIVPGLGGTNVPITAQAGEYIIPKKIVDEIRNGNVYNNDNTKNNIVNINVQGGGMNRGQATDTGFLFSNLLARI